MQVPQGKSDKFQIYMRPFQIGAVCIPLHKCCISLNNYGISLNTY